MAAIRLLVDEDVRPLLTETLRRRGFDTQHVVELERGGLSDPEQLAFAGQAATGDRHPQYPRLCGPRPRVPDDGIGALRDSGV